MTTQFTPGPWCAVQADRDYPVRIRDVAGDLVLATGDDGGHVDPQFALPDETIFANARLMAAAPDLYKELSVRDSDLFMLRRAVEEGDPKAELLIRIDDMIRETKAALVKACAEQVSA